MGGAYGQYIRLNRNVLLALGASVVVSALAAQLLEGQQDHLNTTYTLAVDYTIYFGVFGGLYYMGNRARYGADRQALRRDLARIIPSLGIAEVIYTACRWLAQYHLLAAGYDPYVASIISQGISTVLYMAALNLGVKFSRLYNK